MTNHPVLEATELAQHGRFIYLDARSREEYDAGHSEGAVHVPAAWTAMPKNPDTALDQVEHWEAELRKLGVRDDVLSVVYDNGKMIDAARVWFFLQYFGAPVAIVNGGWPLMQAVDLPPQTTPAQPSDFVAKPGSGAVEVSTRDQLKEELNTNTQIMDSRTEAEYTGADDKGNPRTGHLPGARNISHQELMDDQGRLLDPEALQALFANNGFAPGERIVTHCQAGGRAALAALAAVQAGYTDVSNYYLSFGDWAVDDSCPLEAS